MRFSIKDCSFTWYLKISQDGNLDNVLEKIIKINSLASDRECSAGTVFMPVTLFPINLILEQWMLSRNLHKSQIQRKVQISWGVLI